MALAVRFLPTLILAFALSSIGACATSSSVPVAIDAPSATDTPVYASTDSRDSADAAHSSDTSVSLGTDTSNETDAQPDAPSTQALPPSPFTLGADAVPLRSITAGDPVDDLASLAQIVGDATYVGLGENIHTSGGQHAIRSRMMRYLVEQLGFRAVTLETTYGDAINAQRYVETCEGTPAAALRGLFGVFASVEMRDDLRWMCEWNRAHPTDRVAFFGFDIQNPYYDGAFLRDTLPMLSSSSARAWLANIDECIGATSTAVTFTTDFDRISRTTVERHRQCLEGLDAASNTLAQGTDSLSEEVRAALRVALRSLRASEDLHYYSAFPDAAGQPRGVEPDMLRCFEARDKGMADTLVMMRDLHARGKRVVVIAHNTHIAESQDRFEVAAYQGIRSMGTFLAQGVSTSEGYRAIGISAFETWVNWPGAGQPTDRPLLANASDSAELVTQLIDGVGVLVDLKSTATPPTFPRNRSVAFGHVIEIPEAESFVERTVLTSQFHAVVLLKTSHPMVFGL